MRAVIQRVSYAKVVIENSIHAEIGGGLLIFLGIEDADNQEDISWLSKKIAALRVFPNVEGVMNLSAIETAKEILVVSQFTLHASTKKGNRPSYIRAARPDTAIPLYHSFISEIQKESKLTVKSGVFGAMMDVHLVNDGPVTILIDTKNKE